MTKILKVCFIGPDGVGKSSLILRYTKNTFSNNYGPTIGCDFYTTTFPNHGDPIDLYLWDIAGQENFVHMRRCFLGNTHIAVLCIDLNRQSDELIQPWINEVQNCEGKHTKFVFALTKKDLEPNPTRLDAIRKQLEEKYKFPVIPTSSKTGENVRELFKVIEAISETLVKKSEKLPIPGMN